MIGPMQKTVNALVPETSLAPWAKLLLFWAVYPTIRHSGGLWVGGTLTVHHDQVRFEPNALNRAFLVKDVSFSVPLAEIRSVRVEPGVATNIIVLNTDRSEHRVRCYGAEAFAAAIDRARRQAP